LSATGTACARPRPISSRWRDVEQVANRPEQTEAAKRELKRRVAERMGADDVDLDQPVMKGDDALSARKAARVLPAITSRLSGRRRS
jgi:hypothetical protein